MSANRFDLDLLQSVSDWQRGAGTEKQRVKRGLALKTRSEDLPEFFKTVSLVCYRQVALEKSSVWSLLGKQSLAGRISSWTTNTAVAKTFLNGIPQVDDGLTHLIFAIMPKPEQVVVSLSKLLACPDYQAELEARMSCIEYFDTGTGKHRNTQDEVVLEIDCLEESDIWVLGGWSSSFDQLVQRAYWFMHGCAPTDQQFQELRSQVQELAPEAGARWLQPESTQKVLERVRPTAEALRDIENRREEVRQEADQRATD